MAVDLEVQQAEFALAEALFSHMVPAVLGVFSEIIVKTPSGKRLMMFVELPEEDTRQSATSSPKQEYIPKLGDLGLTTLAPGMVSVISGVVENESEDEALVREFWEEGGVRVDPSQFTWSEKERNQLDDSIQLRGGKMKRIHMKGAEVNLTLEQLKEMVAYLRAEGSGKKTRAIRFVPLDPIPTHENGSKVLPRNINFRPMGLYAGRNQRPDLQNT